MLSVPGGYRLLDSTSAGANGVSVEPLNVEGFTTTIESLRQDKYGA